MITPRTSSETLTLPSPQPDSTLKNPTFSDSGCHECGFRLWIPVAESCHSTLGIYNDARFPGRSIIRLKEHFEDLSDVPLETLTGFMRDIQVAQKAIRAAVRAARVNVAILGNRESHVHAHLIPRFPETEDFPDCSPWNDQRKKTPLRPERVHALVDQINAQITVADRRRSSSKPAPIKPPTQVASSQLTLF